METLQLRLRPLRLPDDIAVALPWYQDPEVLYYSEGEGTEPYSAATVERMYKWLSQNGRVYIIEALEGDAWHPVGDASLCVGMIPIAIGEARYRSRGLGTQVLELLIAEARALGWTRLVAHKIYDYNTRSMRLFERCGFQRTGSGIDEQGRAYTRYERVDI